MAVWEYKVISSGKGGFATPALLEKFLNDLGRDEWEILAFRTAPDNPLAFSGLARRPTQRDWTLQDAAAAAAKAEAEKLRAEFAEKFRAATSAAAPEEREPSFLEETLAPDDGYRKPIDTSRDDDPDAPEEEKAEKDEWDQIDEEEALPTFFDALKPHMRRNQRGPGMSVGVDYLAKKWRLDEGDIKGALVECGLQIPADENAKPVYVEYDGDLYWVNINRRGETWINTREKPEPRFRIVQAQRVGEEPEPAKTEAGGQKPEAMPAEHGEAAAGPAEAPEPAAGGGRAGEPLPGGPALLDRIRPKMRRNRRGGGGSGSVNFLARAMRCSESDLVAAFQALGLVVPENPSDAPARVEIGRDEWWLNKDSRGAIWINGREKRERGEAKAPDAAQPAEPAEAGGPPEAAAPAPEAAPAETTAAGGGPAAGSDGSPFAAVRLLLKETRTGGFAGKVDRVADELGRPAEELVATLVGAGLVVPEKPREKPVFVEHAGEIFWFNRNAKGELWVNAKASKFADGDAAGADAAGEKKSRTRSRRGRTKKDDGAPEAAPEPAAETPES
ncbi:MAG TPA: hypothetical protein VHE13_15875 [Opitutus sp.]|nr:hypothetical protein [Opitutus sp.]